MVTESVVVLTLLGYDALFFLNLFDYHVLNGDAPGHDVLYRPVYFFDKYRIPLSKERFLLFFHILTAAAPLVLSATQCWKLVRRQSLALHRWTGRICIASTLLTIYPSYKLAWQIDTVSVYFQAVIAALSGLWLLSVALTWYYAWKRDIPRHRDWGIRFAAYTHTIPVLSRIVSIPVWLAAGAPPYELYPELKSSTPETFWQVVLFTALLLFPLSEMMVHFARQKPKAQQFRIKKQEDEEGGAGALEPEEDESGPSKSGWDRLNAKVAQIREDKVESHALICKQIGWDVDSIEESNARQLAFKEYSVIDEATEADNVRFLKKQLEELDGAEESEWNTMLLNFNRSFTWPQHAAASSGLDKHADYAAQLEESLEPEKTDYASTMLFLGSEWGEPRDLGTLKYCVRIVELDRETDKEKPSEHAPMSQKDWDGLLDRVKDRFDKSKGLVVRAFVLSGDGLMPPSGNSDCSSYVWSRVDSGGADQDPVYNLKDNLTVRHHTLHPQFNKCHAFSNVRFPDNSVMTLSLVEVIPASFTSGASEKVIGFAEIDLEDRWFNSHYQEMVQTDEVPIESRHLKIAGSVFSKGHVRLWLDIMYNQRRKDCPPPEAFSQERPIESLPSTEPLPFELRLAVFKVVDIQTPDGSVPSVKASGKITLDNGTELFEETDTHFGADDWTVPWRCRNVRGSMRLGQ
eukprot:s210_g1.t1